MIILVAIAQFPEDLIVGYTNMAAVTSRENMFRRHLGFLGLGEGVGTSCVKTHFVSQELYK